MIVNAVTIGYNILLIWYVLLGKYVVCSSGALMKTVQVVQISCDYYVILWFQRTVGKWWYGKSKAIYEFDKQEINSLNKICYNEVGIFVEAAF